MTIARPSIIAARPTMRSLGREIAEKAGDLLPLCDFAALLLAGWFSGLACTTFGAPALLDTWSERDRLTWVAAALAPFILYELRFAALVGAHDNAALARGFARRFLTLLGVVGGIALAGRWLDHASREWLGVWLGCALLLTAASRALLARYLRRLARQGKLTQSIAIVGAGALSDQLVAQLRNHARLFGVFDDQRPSADGAEPPAATLQTLIERAGAGDAQRLDRILIALPATAQRRLLSIVERLRPLGVPVELCPQHLDLGLPVRNAGQPDERVAGYLPVTLLADRPIKQWNAVAKSAEDWLLSSMLMLMLLPLLACIAIAIKLDSAGPVLFLQRRHGLNNREFNIYKFRTMYIGFAAPGGALVQTLRGDSRITRVGRFLRKFSLDELPQIFNVLQGDMSLVGPRPHAVNMRTQEQLGHQITDVYTHRHRVKPGITGWSQINGSRGATDTIDKLRRRVELDLYYVENWSLWFDLKILMLTPREVLRATNAY